MTATNFIGRRRRIIYIYNEVLLDDAAIASIIYGTTHLLTYIASIVYLIGPIVANAGCLANLAMSIFVKVKK